METYLNLEEAYYLVKRIGYKVTRRDLRDAVVKYELGTQNNKNEHWEISRTLLIAFLQFHSHAVENFERKEGYIKRKIFSNDSVDLLKTWKRKKIKRKRLRLVS